MDPPPPAVTLSTLFTVVFPITFLTIFLLRFLLPASSSSADSPPPSPPPLPLIGNLLHVITPLPHRSFALLADHLGPIFLLLLPSPRRPLLLVSSAEDARDVILTHRLVFSSFPRPLTHRLHLKKTHHLLLHTRDTAFYSRQVLQEEVSFLLENRVKMTLSLDLSEIFEGFVIDVMCRVVLGRKYGEGFREMVREMMRVLGDFYFRDYVPWLGWVDWVNGKNVKIGRVKKELDRFIDGVVEERIEKRGGEGRRDLVDELIRLQGGEEGSEIDRDCIKGVILVSSISN